MELGSYGASKNKGSSLLITLQLASEPFGKMLQHLCNKGQSFCSSGATEAAAAI